MFVYSEFFPIAVLSLPLVLDLSASSPIAVLFEPLVFAFNASSPIATFSSPLVKLGIPSSAAPSVKEYKDRLPAVEMFPTLIMLKATVQRIFFLKTQKLELFHSQSINDANWKN